MNTCEVEDARTGTGRDDSRADWRLLSSLMFIIDFALNLGGTVGTSAGLFSFSPSGAMSSRS